MPIEIGQNICIEESLLQLIEYSLLLTILGEGDSPGDVYEWSCDFRIIGDELLVVVSKP